MNELSKETSPYLLQHAGNPVHWRAWNEHTLALAKEQDKLILVSVGYSACHWCHVMEHESFEDEKVAKIMNEHFICIKVDREERPDVDAVYMNAVQLMTQHGGWPLNCFALPDGRPLYGGTYFQKERWIETLINLAELWKNERDKCFDYAAQLTEGVQLSEKPMLDENAPAIDEKMLTLSVMQWSSRFDNSEGGPSHAPKFPLPNNYLFLLRFAHLKKDQRLLDHVCLTLDKMAMGGIYDQIGGGFARYSTDMLWKVPHFEKMLYDNAQLVSLYAEAFQLTKYELYKEVVYETLKFVERELTSPNGAFYSALDADSEGEEGKYYVWTEQELRKILGSEYQWVSEYYNINSIGHWEHGNHILLRRESDEKFCERTKLCKIVDLKANLRNVKEILLSERSSRVRPGLDDKTLTSWNAMMLKGYVDAYVVFGEGEFLLSALRNARFIRDTQLKKNGALFHSWKSGKSSINGFLEDHAFVIDAFIALYQATFDEEWLRISAELCEHVIKHFSDQETPMFFFTSDEDPELIARKMELSDNVCPASNSVMARNFFYLGHLLGKSEYIRRSEQMLKMIQEQMVGYGAGYSNWMILQTHFVFPYREVAIVGNDVDKSKAAFRKHYLPNQIFAGSPAHKQDQERVIEIPLLKNRFVPGKTLIYICENNTCDLPVEDVAVAIEKIIG